MITMLARAFAWLVYPGLSGCGRCGRPWRYGMLWFGAQSHDTQYTDSSGCFPLCEPCWLALGTPERRLPYYEELVARRASQSPTHDYTLEWDQIQRAVRAGR